MISQVSLRGEHFLIKCVEEMARLQSAKIFVFQAHDHKNWFYDAQADRALFLGPQWLSKSANKAKQIGYMEYYGFTQKTMVRKLNQPKEMMIQV